MGYNTQNTNNKFDGIRGRIFLGNYSCYSGDGSLTQEGRAQGSLWTMNIKITYELGRIQLMFAKNNNPDVFELTRNSNLYEITLDATNLSKLNTFLKLKPTGIIEKVSISSKPDKLQNQNPGFFYFEKKDNVNSLIIYVKYQQTFEPFIINGDYQIAVFTDLIETLNNQAISALINYDIIRQHLIADLAETNNGASNNSYNSYAPPPMSVGNTAGIPTPMGSAPAPTGTPVPQAGMMPPSPVLGGTVGVPPSPVPTAGNVGNVGMMPPAGMPQAIS